MSKEKLNVGLLIAAYVPIIILTPFYCMYMAVSQKQEKPYPAATITSTACHYPQDIGFRYFMLIASSLLALIFYMLFRWVQAEAIVAKYDKPISKLLFYSIMLSIPLYGITIGTIDQKGTGKLHGPCAVIFFLILIICIINVTIYLTDLRAYKTSIMNLTSLRAKQALAIYLVSVWIYCIIQIIIVSFKEDWESKTDPFVNIVEWNTVTIGLMWVLTFYWQWQNINLCLIGSKGQSFRQILAKQLGINTVQMNRREQLIE